MAADELITQAELGKRLGITKQAVGDLKSHGKIVMRTRQGKQLVAYNATLAKLEDTLHPSYSRKALKAVNGGDEPEEEPAEHISLGEAQRRKAVAAAALAELELAEKMGSLVDRAAVEKRVFEMARQTRDALLNFPTRYAAVMAADLGVDAGRVNVAIEKRLKEYLGSLADRRTEL